MNQKKENNKTSLIWYSRLILPVALWVILNLCSADFLLKVEERSHFEFDWFWFTGFLKEPSGLLSWLGLFFTQFLYLPWLGSLLWVLLLTASGELTVKIFKVPGYLSVLAYIPAFIFVVYNMSMGYMVYLMNHPGYFFMPVLGYLWALFTVVIIRKPHNPAASLIITIIIGFAGYYIAGFYALAALITACADSFRSDRSRLSRILILTAAAITIVLSPILMVSTTEYYIGTGWTLGLPDHVHTVPLLRMQGALILAMIVLLLISLLPHGELNGKKYIPIIIQFALLVGIIASTSILWYKDANFKTELRMIRAADNMKWEEVTKILEKASQSQDSDWQPTRVMVTLKDLALIKTGKEGDFAFSFSDGSCEQKRKWDVPMSIQIGHTLGFHYGIPGLCQRWCFETSTILGWKNIIFKYSAMTAILFNNAVLSEKFLTKMDNTLFYRKWAKEQRKLVYDRSLMQETAPYDLVLPLLCHEDRIASDLEGCETFIRRHFTGPSPVHSTPMYDRAALLFAMKSKDPTLFWTRFVLYLDSNNPKKIDRFYQEAAYLYSQQDNSDLLLKALPFDEQTKNLYKSFQNLAQRTGPKDLEEANRIFPANLRHTFFYYYYYVNNLKLF